MTIYNDITNTVLSPTVLSTTPTTIIGSIQIPGSAPAGAYNVNVTTADGGTASRPGSFTVGFVGIPAIASLTPVSGYQNTTVNFTVTGTNFEQGTGKTMVTFTNQTTGEILTPGFVNVTSPTQISAGIHNTLWCSDGPLPARHHHRGRRGREQAQRIHGKRVPGTDDYLGSPCLGIPEQHDLLHGNRDQFPDGKCHDPGELHVRIVR